MMIELAVATACNRFSSPPFQVQVYFLRFTSTPKAAGRPPQVDHDPGTRLPGRRLWTMNIAFLVTRADPVGGAQIHVRDLALAVRSKGHSPTVITSGTGPFFYDLRAHQTPVVV